MKYFIYSLLFCMSLSGCGGSSANKKPLKPKGVFAHQDQIDSAWSEIVEIDILANDNYSGAIEIIIVQSPVYGELSVDTNKVSYTPYKERSVADTFSYYLRQNDVQSATVSAAINLKLPNRVIAFERPAVDFFEEGNKYPLSVTLIEPALENTRVWFKRYINGVLDSTYQGPEIVVAKGEDTVAFDYVLEIKDRAGDYEQEHILIAYLADEADPKAEIAYRSLGTPDPDLLHLSTKDNWYNETESARIVNDRGFSLNWMNFPVWVIPDAPTWSENPFENNSWLLYYHSLSWLFAYEYAYQQTGNDEYLNIISTTLLDYLTASPRKSPKSVMSWNDHTVAWRTENLTYFYIRYFKKMWDETQKATFDLGIREHADQLRQLLDDAAFIGHNHGMFHALSLYNYSYAFPAQSAEYDYRTKSLQRIKELYEEMVDKNSGISTEQSSNYHIGAIKLFSNSNKLIGDLSGEYDPGFKVQIENMVDFAAHLIYPDGGAPAMGDSNYGDTGYLKRLNASISNKGIQSGYLDYINTRGNNGTPLLNAYVSTSSGYAIIRPEVDSTWEEKMVLFFDAGKKRFSHGHDDSLNFTLFDDNRPIVVDSGGPYIYSTEQRAYYRSKYAHNTLVIDGEKEDLNDAILHEATCLEEFCYAIGQINQRETLHTRILVASRNKQATVYIFDHVSSTNSHNFELIYHFAADSHIQQEEKIDKIILPGKCTTQISVLSNLSMQRSYYHGDSKTEEKNKQGWLSPKYGLEIPAPVIQYTTQGKNFWSLTEISSNPNSSQLEFNNEDVPTVFSLTTDSMALSIDFSNGSQPVITALP
ncbi:heparinase II/III family protein [Thalassomonas viridans]|uniref:Heparinase II/III family protein n=1 Tax=Thalassomonas viridans TaxID=137584 RepID=A0AAF0CCN8_9GAMM|nr:heparinase II/III family protein [Thalassomonas viridans]WDE08578.1 heparinase II/III family protein [Thalassomonas viridans]